MCITEKQKENWHSKFPEQVKELTRGAFITKYVDTCHNNLGGEPLLF